MAVHDYEQKISDYLKGNFTQGNPDHPGVLRMRTSQLLSMLFQAFPHNCISVYELTDILEDLGYSPQTWIDESVNIQEDGDEETHTINKHLAVGWCLKSNDFNLEPEIRVISKDR